MELTQEQRDAYRTDGILVIEAAFSGEEMAEMRRAFERDAELPGPQRVLEEDGRSVRAVYASHQREPVFERLVRSQRLLGCARDLVAPRLYVWQFKINTKRPFGGAAWAWHQDYIVWRAFDGLPMPEAISAVVFLDEVNEFNGPIVFIPGSHRDGVIEPPARSGGPTSVQHVDPADFEIPDATIAALVSRLGIVAPKGPAGSMLLFHPNIVHASGMNISPFRRDLLIVTYNALDNAPSSDREPRASYLVGAPGPALELADGPAALAGT